MGKNQSKYNYGSKLRDVEIDKTQHVFELTFAVLVFATILIAAIMALGVLVYQWYVWALCGLVLVYFIIHSTMFIVKTWKNPKYILHETGIICNSIWSYKGIRYYNITDVYVKKSMFDKLQKEEMNSIVIVYDDGEEKKAVMHCITEDVFKLVEEIKSKCVNIKKEVVVKQTKKSKRNKKAE